MVHSIVFQDDPHGMNDPRDVSKESQQQIEPKVQPKTNLQENTQRRDKDCEQNANDVGVARTHAKKFHCERQRKEQLGVNISLAPPVCKTHSLAVGPRAIPNRP